MSRLLRALSSLRSLPRLLPRVGWRWARDRLHWRWLPAIATAHAVGIALADRFGPPSLVCATGAAVGLLAAYRLGRRGARAGSASALLLAFACLGAHGLVIRAAPPRAPDGLAWSGEAVVEARVRRSMGVVSRSGLARRVELDAVRAVAEVAEAAESAEGSTAAPPTASLFAAVDDPAFVALEGLAEGDRLRARLRFAPLDSRANPGAADRATASRRRGLAARAELVHPGLLQPIDRERRPVWVGWGRWREGLVERLAEQGRGGRLLAALALGEGSAVVEADRGAASRLGLSHLLAVSGLHVAVVLATGFAAARRLLARCGRLARRRDVRPFALLFALAGAGAYAWLAGGRPPVVRAWVLAACVALGWVAGRRRAAPESLSAAALVVLARDPAALFDPGAQLSFAACAGLLARPVPADLPAALDAEAEPRASLPARLAAAFARSIWVTCGAVAATAPVLALHAGRASPWSLVTNGLAVPWTSLVLLPTSLVSAGLAAAGPASPGSWRAEWLSACAAFARLHLDALRGVAEWLPVLPVASHASLGEAAPPALPFLLVAAGLAVLAVRARRMSSRLVGCVVTVAGLALAPTPGIDPPPPRVVVLDVGQADAVLVQGRDASILVDAGGAIPGRWDAGSQVVLPALRALGVSRLAALALTHADLDHRGGAAAVLSGLPVEELWLPAGAEHEPAWGELARLARDRGGRVRWRSNADPAERIGDLRVEVLWPPPGAARSDSRNEGSLVLAIAAGAGRVLSTGDAGRETEDALLGSGTPLRASLLKVGHHGSGGGSSGRFLEAVDAGVALVSAPCPGRAGLPDAGVLGRLVAAGSEVGWTGRDGALLASLAEPGRWRRWRSGVSPCRVASRPHSDR